MQLLLSTPWSFTHDEEMSAAGSETDPSFSRKSSNASRVNADMPIIPSDTDVLAILTVSGYIMQFINLKGKGGFLSSA